MSSTTGLGKLILGTSSLTGSSSRAPSSLQGTPLSPFTISAEPFLLSGSLLKLLAFTTAPSAVPTKLSLLLRQ
eukprot:6321348-Amphidinium_carterae.1